MTQSQHSSVDLPQSVIDRIAKDYNIHIQHKNSQDGDESMSSLTPSQFPDLSYNAHKRTIMRGNNGTQHSHSHYHHSHSYNNSSNNHSGNSTNNISISNRVLIINRFH